MDVAFILHVNITDVTTLADTAADISDDLTSAGHDVVSVVPWQRPTLNPTPTGALTLAEGLAPPPTEPLRPL